MRISKLCSDRRADTILASRMLPVGPANRLVLTGGSGGVGRQMLA